MINLYYQNVRGLRTKTIDFFHNIVCNDYDVITLSETWLNSSVFDSELFDNRYVVYRRDRETTGFHSKKNGGGVCIAVSRRFNSRRLQNLESKCEDLWVCTECYKGQGKTEQLYLCAVYLPPPIQHHILDEFLTNSNKVLDSNNIDNVLFLGDFNLPSVSWNNSNNALSINKGCNNGLFATMLADFIMLNNLNQFNNTPNNKGKLLDLILSNVAVSNSNVVNNPLSVVDPLHPPLHFTMSFVSDKSLIPNDNSHFCFHKADYENIVSNLREIMWDEEFEKCNSVDDMLSLFYNHLRKAINVFVPKSQSKPKKYPVWFSRDLINRLKEKLKYRRKLRKFNNNPLDLLAYELTKKRSEHLLTSCYNNYISRLESSIRSNPKLFWSFIKTKKKQQSHYPAQMVLNKSVASNGKDICNLFAQNFSAVYNYSMVPSRICEPVAMLTNNYLTSIQFKDNQVLKVLKRLDPNKGAGSDGIPSVFALKCAVVLAHPLRLIFNKSLDTGIFPSDWKLALVVPLHKNGNKDLIVNYRPISILPVFGKVFEQLLHPILSWHFKQLISPNQHGFTKARSTATNLFSFMNAISTELDKRLSVDAVYTDFSKAFDRVNHQILLNKLSANGIAQTLLNWCGSYLASRKSLVVANGYSSDAFSVDSGVPQGSHLGPLFFNVFINDIGNCFHHCDYYLFADDLKIFRVVNTPSDAMLLQDDLNRLHTWCQSNGMDLNSSKCYTLKFSKKRTNIVSIYKINDDVLQEVDHIKDLGVVLDSKLRLNLHVDNICSKAFRCLGFVLRNCKGFKCPRTKILLYNALVRSGLEYCSVTWNPFYDIYTKRIESVQKRFLWHLAYSCNLAKSICSYPDRLKHFKMSSLSNRRLLLDLLFLHKLANGSLDASDLLSLLNFAAPTRLPRASRFNLLKDTISKSNLGQNGPINRLVREYNSISKNDSVDLFGLSISKFKCAIMSI